MVLRLFHFRRVTLIQINVAVVFKMMVRIIGFRFNPHVVYRHNTQKQCLCDDTINILPTHAHGDQSPNDIIFRLDILWWSQ